MEDCEKYLGLPMVGGKSKMNTFRDLQEKITKRVMGWKEKFISKVGREIQVKMVAQAISTYSMGIFKIPKALCDTMNSTLAKYWWGKTKMRGKSIGLTGRSYVLQRKMVVWIFVISKRSIQRYQLNKSGV